MLSLWIMPIYLGISNQLKNIFEIYKASGKSEHFSFLSSPAEAMFL